QAINRTPIFFFSSRRRHTRWPRDWSSDVCSSDLSFDPPSRRLRLRAQARGFPSAIGGSNEGGPRRATRTAISRCLAAPRANRRRSEERRVGKERRDRRGLFDGKEERNKLKPR